MLEKSHPGLGCAEDWLSLWQATEWKLSESSLGGGQDVKQGPMAPSYWQQEAFLCSGPQKQCHVA